MMTKTMKLLGDTLMTLALVTVLCGCRTVDSAARSGDRDDLSRVNVRTFGAKGDGKTDDAPAIQAAIDACPQAGTVLVPEGHWLVQSSPLRLRSGITLQGHGQRSVIIRDPKLRTCLAAEDASRLRIERLRFVVTAATPAKMEGRLAHFQHCREVTVRECEFDGAATNGLPSQFSLCQFECCNDVKCLDNRFRNTAGSATGVTGASWEPEWGRRSEFARNVVEDYCDTGIGLWTGAREAHVHHNRLRGRAEKFTSYPVGIDVDGGTHSLIEHNDIADGHIAIRLYDCHDGAYPMTAIVVRDNFLHDQRTYDAHHPAWAIKPENPKSRLEASIEGNRIVQQDKHASAMTGGGAGHTILHVNLNEFTGVMFWNFEYYAANALAVFSGGKRVDWRTGIGNNTQKGPK